MFKKAGLYNNGNSIQRQDASRVLARHSHMLRWRDNERILDVGSGSGNVTTEVLLPYLPKNFKHLVGIDISENMVKCASANNTNPRITYTVGNIAQDDKDILFQSFTEDDLTYGFDKVFSFYCLHWVRNYPQWARNIQHLLRSGGQALLMLLTWNSVMDIRNSVAFSDKWRLYMKNETPFKYVFHDTLDPAAAFEKLLTSVGFRIEACEVIHRKSPFPERLRAALEAMDPFIHNVPEELHVEYMDDVIRTACEYRDKTGCGGLPYSFAAILVSKP